MVAVFVGKQMAEGDAKRRSNVAVQWLGEGDSVGEGTLVLHRGNQGQDSVDHSHYFVANEERGGHLSVACVPLVDGNKV